MAVNFPPNPTYPTEYDSDGTLFLVYNSSESKLSKANSAWDEVVEIEPTNPVQWADNGFATIDGELFYYGGVDKDSQGRIYRFKGCARNLSGKPTKYNAAGTIIRGLVVAEHHNQLSSAIINTEKFVGYNFDTDTTTVDWRVRNLLAQNIIYNDYDCPDVVFNYGIISDSPITGTVISYSVVISGAYGAFQIDFGDGTSSTALTGFHTYSPNVKIDPVAVVSNNDCEIVQTPIQRNFAEEPKGRTPFTGLQIPVPKFPDFPSIFFPSIAFPSLDIKFPPTILPCIDLSKINIPSFPSIVFPSFQMGNIDISINNGFPSGLNFSGISVNFNGVFPSTVNFGPAPSFAPIAFGPAPTLAPIGFAPTPTLGPVAFGPAPTITANFGPAPTIGPVAFGPAPTITANFGPAPSITANFGPAPSITANFGPAPTITVNFGPAPSIGPILFGVAPSFSPILFGPAPSFAPINFGTAPTINVNWGTPPTLSCNVSIQCPSTGAASIAPMYSPLRDSPLAFADSPQIDMQYEIGGIPSEIKLVAPDFLPTIKIESQIPSTIEINFKNLDFPEINLKGPESIPLSFPLDMPTISLAMPKEPFISLAVPNFIDLRVPDGLRVPLVFDGPPLSAELKVNWNIDKLNANTEGLQCFALVPCPRT
jgi:hypothetical protein